MKKDTLFVLLCEIANNIHERKDEGIVAAKDYRWKLKNSDNGCEIIIKENK